MKGVGGRRKGVEGSMKGVEGSMKGVEGCSVLHEFPNLQAEDRLLPDSPEES